MNGPAYWYYANCQTNDDWAMARSKELTSYVPTLGRFGFKSIVVVQGEKHFADPVAMMDWWSGPRAVAKPFGIEFVAGMAPHEVVLRTKYGTISPDNDGDDIEGAMADPAVWSEVKLNIKHAASAGFTTIEMDDEWWAFDRMVRPVAAAHWTAGRIMATIANYVDCFSYAKSLGVRLLTGWQAGHESFALSDPYRQISDALCRACGRQSDPAQMYVTSSLCEYPGHGFAADSLLAAMKCRCINHPGMTFALTTSRSNVPDDPKTMWPAGKGPDGVYRPECDWRKRMKDAGLWGRSIYFGNPAVNVPLMAAASG